MNAALLLPFVSLVLLCGETAFVFSDRGFIGVDRAANQVAL
jgi:hypothetical protein